MRCFYAKGRDNTDIAREGQLYLNNCGYYRDVERTLCISRPSGRSDYHILFCARGEIAVAGQQLHAGDMYLFFPHREQEYRYLAATDSLYFWLHFNGKSAAEEIAAAGLSAGLQHCGARATEAETLFRMMAHALGDGNASADRFALSLLSPLLLLMAAGGAAQMPFHRALRLLADTRSEVRISELAATYGMSREHFIRTFTGYMGQTPYQYRQKKRLDLAKLLLADSTESVADVAAEIGYPDPQYFCRIFKKAVGMTPTQYRKRKRLH